MSFFEEIISLRVNEDTTRKIKRLKDHLEIDDDSMLIRTLVNKMYRILTDSGVIQ
jgi:hypothetical protein